MAFMGWERLPIKVYLALLSTETKNNLLTGLGKSISPNAHLKHRTSPGLISPLKH